MPNRTETIDSRYEVLEELGSGTMGSVFKAYDMAQDKVVALKIMILDDDEEDVGAWLAEEFSTLTKLRHPNLAGVLDYGSLPQGGQYFTMEYVEGDTLEELAGELQYDDIYQIIVQICRSLEYVHSRGLIHRDVKPGNIIISRDDRGDIMAKLMDFGLAVEESVGRRLRAGGTSGYMAPEVARGQPADKRVDLYALGVTLFEAATGKLPFVGEDAVSVMMQHMNDNPPRPAEIRPEMPKPLEEIILKLMEKEPSDRFSSANEVIRYLNREVSDSFATETKDTYTSYVLSGKFVGRDRELKRLMSLFNEVVRGDEGETCCNLAVVVGEPGVGKTRLLREFKNRIQLEGCRVFENACSRGESQAYQAFTPIIREAIRSMGSFEELDESAKTLGSDLVKIVPELKKWWGAEPSRGLPGDLEKIRMMASANDLLIRVADQRPTAVMIGDLHWADNATLELMSYIARNSPGSRLLLCGTARAEEAIVGSLRKQLDELESMELAVVIELTPIQSDDVTQLIRSMLGTDSLPDGLAEAVMSRTGGNPFFVEEAMKSLVEEGEFLRNDGNWEMRGDALSKISIPASLSAVISDRLNRLDYSSKRVLQCMAVFNHPIPHRTVRRMMDASESETAGAMAAVQKKGLTVTVESTGGVLSGLKHDTLRDAVYETIGDYDKQELHDKAGKIIESDYPDQLDKHAGELAHHFLHGTDRKKALNYGLMAANRCKKLYANEEAKSLYVRCLALMGEGEDPRRPELLWNLSEALSTTGMYAEAVENLKSLLELLGNRCTPGGEEYESSCAVRRKIAEIYLKMSEHDSAREYLNTALKSLNKTEDKKEAVRLLNTLATLLLRQGELADAENKCLEALETAGDDTGNKEVSTVYNTLGVVSYYAGNFAAALRFWNKGLEIREAIEDLHGKAAVLSNLGGVHYGLGDAEKAISCWQESKNLNEDIGDPFGLAITLNNLGTAYCETCRYTKARDYWKRSSEVWTRIAGKEGMALSWINVGSMELLLGDTASARRKVERGLELCRKFDIRLMLGEAHQALGEIAMEEGNLKEAGEKLGRALDVFRMINNPNGICSSMMELARLRMLEGNRVEAASLAGEALKTGEQIGSVSQIARSLCILGQSETDNDQRKEELLRRSIQLASDMNLRETIWEASHALGEMLHMRGEYREALSLYSECISIFREICRDLGEEEACNLYLNGRGRQRVPQAIERLKQEAMSATESRS
jgi:tetratricopeptide (TPR) repeat protein/predicted Ser/Thr protein kinase